MNCILHRFGRQAALCFLIVGMATVARGAVDTDEEKTAAPDNKVLIAAMPADTESVLIWKYDELLKDNSFMQDATRTYLEHMTKQADEDDPLGDVKIEIRQADVIVEALGGSKFTGPERRGGAGDFVERSIVVTRNTLTDVEESLAQGTNVNGKVTSRELLDKTVYELTVNAGPKNEDNRDQKQRKRFIAFPDEHTAVITEAADEIEPMLQSLQERNNEIPEQWKPLAEHADVSSPLVILRQYNKENKKDPLSPVNPRLPDNMRTGIYGYAVTLPNVEKKQLRMYARTTEPDKALRFLPQIVTINRSNWDVNQAANGFVAEIAMKPSEQRPGLLFLSALVMFGQFVMI